MIVQFTTENGENPFKNAIVTATLDAKKSVKMVQCLIKIEVQEWSEFLRFVWKAYAECSKDHRGKWCVKRTSVSVHLEDGRVFSTFIWYDVEAKGLRYVSLH